MAKILFHCGAHKTASTHFQHNLELNKAYLETKKIKYFKFQECEDLRLKVVEFRGNVAKPGYNVEEAIQYIKAKLDREISGYELAIISYEGALGHMNTFDCHTIYPNYKELIRLYKIIFEGHEVTPVFVTRDYRDYVLSAYKYQIKHGRTFKLSSYLANFKLEAFRWTNIITELQNTFSTPLVWTYENYKKDPQRMLYVLLNNFFKNIDDPKELITDTARRNTGSSENSLNLYFMMNKVLNNRFVHASRKKKIFVNKVIIDRWLNKIDTRNFFSNCMDVDISNYFDSKQPYGEEVKRIMENKICNCLDTPILKQNI